ncbi:hypothetical protein WDV06_16935 [Streptomyces racemochromogenes]|uniref:Uncharacterized protein n=1 Tax=Streptomyces racemochromogenes TaxID=67353 RepID=A0ABW7PEF1_9ACTN
MTTPSTSRPADTEETGRPVAAGHARRDAPAGRRPLATRRTTEVAA